MLTKVIVYLQLLGTAGIVYSYYNFDQKVYVASALVAGGGILYLASTSKRFS